MNLSINARLTASTILAGFLIVVGTGVADDQAQAQSVSSRKAAEDVLRAGLAAQKARRHGIAVSHFSRAISAGSLDRKQLTYALYRRAISNRAQKQSAQAISDLNSALFFKGDLSMRDRADAIEERMKAFRDAGLPPTAVATAGPAAQWKPAARAAQAPTTPPRSRVIATAPPRVVEPVQVVKPRPSGSVWAPTAPILAPSAKTAAATQRAPSNFQTRVEATPVPVRTAPQSPSASSFSHATPKVERGVGVPSVTRQAPVRASAATPWQVATKSAPLVAIAPAPVARVNPASTVRAAIHSSTVASSAANSAGWNVPTAKPVTPTSPDGGVGQFFSSLFGGSGTEKSKTSPIATASVKRDVATPASSRVKAKLNPVPASRPAIDRPVQVAVAQPVVRAPHTPAAPGPEAHGKLEIVVAELRNKHRADALARQLMVQYAGGGFWSAKKTARVVANGAINEEDARYFVRYGAYDSRGALEATCAKFKANGLGCEVVAAK